MGYRVSNWWGGVPTDTSHFNVIKLFQLNNAQVAKSIPSSLLMPMTKLRVQRGFGPMWGFKNAEFGGSLGGFSLTGTTQVNPNSLGFDFKANLFEQDEYPFTLTLGSTAEYSGGKVVISDGSSPWPQSGGGYTHGGQYALDFTTSFYDLALTLQTVASRQWAFFRPSLGFGLQINSGSTNSKAQASGVITSTNNSNPSDTSTQTILPSGTGVTPVKALDSRWMLGAEFTFWHILVSLGAESGLSNGGVSAHLAAAAEF